MQLSSAMLSEKTNWVHFDLCEFGDTSADYEPGARRFPFYFNAPTFSSMASFTVANNSDDSKRQGPDFLLASTSKVKQEALRKAFNNYYVVDCVEANSGVPEQPVGRDEIRHGCLNRLMEVGMFPTFSFESGIVVRDDWKGAYETSCCMLRTRLGIFESWTGTNGPLIEIPKAAFDHWKDIEPQDRQDITLGSIIDPSKEDDWYADFTVKRESRSDILARLAENVYRQWVAHPLHHKKTINAPFFKFKGIEKFMDIQSVLTAYPKQVMDAVKALSDGVVFDTVAVMESRGFLFASMFAEQQYPIVMLRKRGKLPGEVWEVKYEKEYGSDSLQMQKGIMKEGARVLVVDDLVATGGSLRAADHLIQLAGGIVVGFVCPFAALVDQAPNSYIIRCQMEDPRLRFWLHQDDLREKTSPPKVMVHYGDNYSDKLFITTPEMLPTVLGHGDILLCTHETFYRSPNIWFQTNAIRGRDVVLVVDVADPLQLQFAVSMLNIMHRKDPKSVRLVLPFLEHATQDRIEYKRDHDLNLESLAMVDCIAKIVGKHTVITFDLHCEQSQFSFFDLRFANLIVELWKRYSSEHPDVVLVFPDQGAKKRFEPLLEHKGRLVTFHKERHGNERKVFTFDSIPKNKTCVIVDDMVRSGGTVTEVAKYCKEEGAYCVDAVFAHAPLEPKAVRRLYSHFREIWTSNTVPNRVPKDWIRVDFMNFVL